MNVFAHPNHSRPFVTACGFLLLLLLSLPTNLRADPPRLTSPTANTCNVNEVFTYQIGYEYLPENPAVVRYDAWVEFQPVGAPALTLVVDNVTGLFSCTPSGITPTGSPYGIRLSVLFADGTNFSPPITLAVLNPPVPVITTSTNRVVKVGQYMQHQFEATPRLDVYYSTSPLPPGLGLLVTPAGDAQIQGIPTERGSYTITVSATVAGETGSTNIFLRVTHPQPWMPSWDNITLLVGQHFTYTVTTNPTADATPTLFDIPEGSRLPLGLSIDPNSGVIFGIPELATPETRCYIRATNEGGEGFMFINFTVLAPQAPVITTVTNRVVRVNQYMQHQIEATPRPDTYSTSELPPGLELFLTPTGNAWIQGIPTVRASYTITVSATFAGETGSTNIFLRVTHPQPWMPSWDNITLLVGQHFTYTVTTNPTADATPTLFDIPEGSRLPLGLSIDPNSGVIFGIPELAAPETRCYIRATNEGGEGFMFINFTVLAPQAPVITSPDTASATAGEPFTCSIIASNSPTSYTAAGLPPGLSINPLTGEITGTPEPGCGGVYSVTISARNEGGTTIQSFTLIVFPSGPAHITSPREARARVGEPLVYRITGDNCPNRYSVIDEPHDPRVEFLRFEESSGLIYWTPPNVSGGTYQVDLQIYADNGIVPIAHEVLRVFVFPPDPVITSVSSATARVGERFGFQITTSPRAPETPTTFSATGLPVGLTISDAGFIQGFPERVETIDATISARNDGGEESQILRITVRPPLPSITSESTAHGTLGISFNYTITATGNPSSFSATLPPDLGLELDSLSGLISGRPTMLGTFPITLVASNIEGSSEPRFLTLTVGVIVLPRIPVITSATTASATVGEPFTYMIRATEYPVSFVAEDLPPGLNCDPISGVISGTPFRGGIYLITLRASNIAHVGSGTLTLSVSPEPPVITSPLTARTRVGRDFSYKITATGISPINITVGSLPPRLRFDSANNEIYGFAAGPAIYHIPLHAINAGGATEEILTLEVGRWIRPYFPNLPYRPSQPIPNPFGTEWFYQGEKGLPLGLTIDRETGEIKGTTSARGSYDVTFFASTANETNSLTFTLVVADLLFKKVDNSIAISGTNPKIGGDVILPAMVDNLPITSIDAEAFRNCTDLTSVEIPESVTSIGDYAFAGCTELTRVTFLGNAPSAGNSVFLNTPEVKVYYLPSKSGWSNTFADRWTARMIPPPVLTSHDIGYAWEGSMDRYPITSDPTATEAGAIGILPLGLGIDLIYHDVWGAPESGTAGHYPVKLWASNEGGTTTKDFTFIVFPKPPVITSPHTATACEGEPISPYTITATSSPDGYLMLGGLPLDLTFDAGSGVISGTPAPGSEGTYTVHLFAYNLGGPGDPHTLTLTVGPPAPVITSSSRVAACVGEPFAFTISASGLPSNFSAILLPPGLTINPVNGVISGVPSTAGFYIVNLSASNACGSGIQKLEITVNAAAPVITSPRSANGWVGADFHYRITATHFPTSFGAVRFFPVWPLGLPDGLMFNVTNGVLHGSPNPGSEDTYLITLFAINACGIGTQTLELTIRPSIDWWPRIRFEPARKRTFMMVQDGGGKEFLVEYTDDFLQWFALSTKLKGEMDLSELDPQSATRPFRFYRISQP